MLLGRKRWHEHKASKKSIFISDKTLIHSNHRDYGHDTNRIGSAMYIRVHYRSQYLTLDPTGAGVLGKQCTLYNDIYTYADSD